MTIDLLRLAALDAPEKEVLHRYVTMIQIQRGDFNGKVITIRREDVSALGRVFERDESGHAQPAARPGSGGLARRPPAQPLNGRTSTTRPPWSAGLNTMLISLTAARVAVEGTE